MSRSTMWTRHAQAGQFANVTRIAWGVFFVGSAVFNTLITAPNAEQVYLSFAGMSWPVAEQLVRHLVVPVGMAFTLLVAAFELAVGILILRRRSARLGIVISLAWLGALIPFLDGYGLVNVVLIIALAPLLRYDYRMPCRFPDRADA
jgi:hypothetical protein